MLDRFLRWWDNYVYQSKVAWWEHELRAQKREFEAYKEAKKKIFIHG
jgi:hypothetical protein